MITLERLLDPWTLLGFVAQGLFVARFLVQWIASERAGRSYIPLAFWYLSLGASSLLLLYSVHIKDPVFVLGQSMGLMVYVRNVTLLHRARARQT